MEKNNTVRKSKISTKKIAIVGMLSAITVILGMTPLGFIPLGVFNVTIIHIPVIIAAILEGPVVAGFVGLMFGLTSLFKHLTAPGPISFLFWNPLISVFPRVMIGIGSYYFYKGFIKLFNKEKTAYFLTGIVGTLINTTLVLGLAYIFYAQSLVEKLSLPNGAGAFLLGIATANGVPEMLFSAVVTMAVVTAVKKFKN